MFGDPYRSVVGINVRQSPAEISNNRIDVAFVESLRIPNCDLGRVQVYNRFHNSGIKLSWLGRVCSLQKIVCEPEHRLRVIASSAGGPA